MLLKVLFLLFLVYITTAIRANHQFSNPFSNNGPPGKKGRTYEQVCQHYNGTVCDKVAGIGRKCCGKGLIGNKVCDTFGCEHDTVSISNMNWDY